MPHPQPLLARILIVMQRVLAFAFVAATVVLLTTACGADPKAAPAGGTGGGGGGNSGSVAVGEKVVASDFSFSPSKLELQAGDKVDLTFQNEDSTTHSFTSDELAVDVEAEGGASESVSFTAPESGTAEWHCRFHSQMTGEISVGGGADKGSKGGTEGGQTESGDDGGAY
ncbi:MAG: cupredoxin domain-containing protein [Actinobacteria bacterium]|nr:cupredoxin domain-containing protein [Actinomycetota bacterium]